MTHRTISPERNEVCGQQMMDPMSRLARTLSAWVQAEAGPLQESAAQVVRGLHIELHRPGVRIHHCDRLPGGRAGQGGFDAGRGRASRGCPQLK